MSSRIRITWQSYLLFSIVSILAVPLALEEQLSPKNFLVFSAIGLGITAFIGLLIFQCVALIDPWLRTQSRSTQEYISLSIIAASGALRGVLFYLSIEWFDYIQPSNIWTRVGTSTATALLWFTPIAIIVTSTQTFREDYENLLRNAVLAISGKFDIHGSNALPTKLETDLLEIEEILGEAFSGENLPNSSESLTFAAVWIRSLIEEKIRPLSHRLWIESVSTPPKIYIGTSVTESVRFLNIPPLPIAFFLSLTTFINITASIGWVRGVFATLIILIEIYLLLSYFQRKISWRTFGNFSINAFLLLIPGLLLSLTFYLSNRFIFNYSFGLLNLIYVLLFLMVAIPISTFQLANRDRGLLLTTIEENLLASGWLDEYKQKYLTRNAAAYLHNLLQSELLAISRHMENSVSRNEPIGSTQDLEELLSRLHRPLKDDFQKFLYDPIARLNKLPLAWKGIAEIDISLPHHSLQNQGRNLLLVQFIEEAIANAVRHANADQISVHGQLLPNDRVQLTILNNGSSSSDVSVGMGTALLNHHAPNSWNRRQNEDGTELIVTI